MVREEVFLEAPQGEAGHADDQPVPQSFPEAGTASVRHDLEW